MRGTFCLDTIAARRERTAGVLIPVDAGYSTEVQPIHMEAAVNQTTKSEDKHMNTDKYVGLDVHKVDTQVVIAEERLPDRRHLTDNRCAIIRVGPLQVQRRATRDAAPTFSSGASFGFFIF